MNTACWRWATLLLTILVLGPRAPAQVSLREVARLARAGTPVALSYRGNWLIAEGADRKLRLCAARRGKLIIDLTMCCDGIQGPYLSMHFWSGQRRRDVYTERNFCMAEDQRIRFFPSDLKHNSGKVWIAPEGCHTRIVALSEDWARCAVFDRRAVPRVVAADYGRDIGVLPRLPGAVAHAEWSTDARRLGVACPSPGLVRVFPVSRGGVGRPWRRRCEGACWVGFAGGGSMVLAYTRSGVLCEWAARDIQPSRRLYIGVGAHDLAVANGTDLWMVADGRVRRVDLREWRAEDVGVAGRPRVQRLLVSTDGRTIAASLASGQIRIYRTAGPRHIERATQPGARMPKGV